MQKEPLERVVLLVLNSINSLLILVVTEKIYCNSISKKCLCKRATRKSGSFGFCQLKSFGLQIFAIFHYIIICARTRIYTHAHAHARVYIIGHNKTRLSPCFFLNYSGIKKLKNQLDKLAEQMIN